MSRPRRKKERGRPLENRYPPRVDATPEDIAQAMFSLPAGRKWEYMETGPEGTVYRCVNCVREVHYPDTLYSDGRCERCHAAVKVGAE